MIFKQLIQDNEVLTSIDDNNSDQLTISDSVSGSGINIRYYLQSHLRSTNR